MATDDPPWLRAWTGGDAPAQPAQAGQQRESQGAGRGSGTSSDKRTTGQRFNTGFSEPQPWSYDGGKRRKAVLDLDRNPPMPIRHVGWRVCITCARPYWSEDVRRIRMCAGCKSAPETAKPLRL